uniref:NB-ARC domain-containing protein n=1 Tax=Vitis vinifera TaxID=29760 RepID=F6I5H0_VITVI
MSTEGGRTSISFPPDMSTIVGREDDKEKIVDMLLDSNYDTEVGIPVIRIVGMTGMGKTTLAQLVYLDARVVKRFKENRIWVCVTVNFDLSRILRDIMMRSNPNINHTNSSLNQLCEDFQKFVRGKCFLLVLDDVWTDNDEEWKRLLDLLREGAKQSRVLATSQKTEVCHVQYMQITHNLNFLSYNDCWSLFQRTAFGQDHCPSQLVESGTRIVRKCQNLPLAVKAMGSFLGRNLDPKKWRKISELDIWEAEKGEPKSTSPSIFPALKVSYNQCFQNRTGDRTGKVTGSRFTGRTGGRTAIEPLLNRWFSRLSPLKEEEQHLWWSSRLSFLERRIAPSLSNSPL